MLTILLYIFLSVSAEADKSQTNHFIQIANSAYQDGEFEVAIENYNAALQLGYANSALYYNLGNAYFKNNELAQAILNYERAKKMAPRDSDIQFNLEITNLFIVDKITQIPPHFIKRMWNAFNNSISTDQQSIVVLVLYILAVSLLITKLLVRKNTINKLSQTLFIPALFIFVLFSVLFVFRVHEDLSTKAGIIIVDKIEVKNSPSADASDAFALHEGTKVNILDNSGDFYKIAIADGNIGWLPEKVLSII
jgi:tetratricopeptide (TPR) repeat protein